MTPKSDHFSSEFSLKDLLSIRDRTLCERAIRNGGIAAMVLAGITAAWATVVFFTAATDPDLWFFRAPTDLDRAYLLDPLRLVDVVLPVVLGVFVFRHSRMAATTLLVYFVASKIVMWAHFGYPRDLVHALVFSLFFVTAMRGTFLWHKAYKQAGTATVAGSPKV
ncbi:MAG: hypothetical protein ACK5ZV_06050 [bacterium]